MQKFDLIKEGNTHVMFSLPMGQYTRKDPLEEEVINYVKNIDWSKNLQNDIGRDFQLFENETFSNIKEFCEQCVYAYYNNLLGKRSKLRISLSWANRTKPGQEHHIHKHPNSIISGVFYLNDSPESRINLVSPFDDITQMHDISREDAQLNEFNWSEYHYNPQKNTCVLFPSYVRHYVSKNTSDEDRYSIAFNTFFDYNQQINMSASALNI
jgi:uncharacterized protein (TIGR02466 family)